MQSNKKLTLDEINICAEAVWQMYKEIPTVEYRKDEREILYNLYIKLTRISCDMFELDEKPTMTLEKELAQIESLLFI